MLNLLRITRNCKYSYIDGVHKVTKNSDQPDNVDLNVHCVRRMRRTPSQQLMARQERLAAKTRNEAKRLAVNLQAHRSKMVDKSCMVNTMPYIDDDVEIVLPRPIPVELIDVKEKQMNVTVKSENDIQAIRLHSTRNNRGIGHTLTAVSSAHSGDIGGPSGIRDIGNVPFAVPSAHCSDIGGPSGIRDIGKAPCADPSAHSDDIGEPFAIRSIANSSAAAFSARSGNIGEPSGIVNSPAAVLSARSGGIGVQSGNEVFAGQSNASDNSLVLSDISSDALDLSSDSSKVLEEIWNYI